MHMVEITLQLAVNDGADWLKELVAAVEESKDILAVDVKRDAPPPEAKPKRKYTRRAPKQVDTFYGQPQGTTVVKVNGDGTKTEMRK